MNYITFTHNGKKYATTFTRLNDAFYTITSGILEGNLLHISDVTPVYGIEVQSEQHFVDFINFNRPMFEGVFFTYHFIDNIAILICSSWYCMEVIFEAYKSLTTA